MPTETLATSRRPDAAAQPLAKKIISFPALLGVLLAAGMFIPLRNFWIDPDVWWHIKVGATILATHHFPTTDPYSYTAYGTHWIAYQWLGEVVIALFAKLWGLRGLMALDIILAAAILLALYALVTMRCGNSKAGFAASTLFLPLVYASLSLRPQMLGYLFLILTMIILERFRQGHMAELWLLPPLFLIWVNTHGIFTLGLFAMVVYWACGLVEIHWGGMESRRWSPAQRVRLELVGLLTLVALLITPYGAELLLYPLDLASSQQLMVANIEEWQPMMFDKPAGKLFLAYIVVFLFAQVAMRLRWRLEEVVLLLTAIAGACLHFRLVMIFVSFVAPLFGVVIARAMDPYDPRKDKYALNAILMALAVVAVIRYFPPQADLERIMEQKWPVQAVAYLRRHPAPQPMFNSYGFGGYLIWKMSDTNKVFIDGRADIYVRSGAFMDYLNIARMKAPAPFLLKAYNVQSCLLAHDESLITLLDDSPDWQKVYNDPVAVLYVRRPRVAGAAGR